MSLSREVGRFRDHGKTAREFRWVPTFLRKYFVTVHHLEESGCPIRYRLKDNPLNKPECESEICFFGREWIHCRLPAGHRGEHRDGSGNLGWEEGDERA